MMTERDFVRRFTEDPAGTVGELGLEIPPGLSLEALGMGKPGPDWVPFEIVLGNCRTYWKKAEPDDPYPGVDGLLRHQDRRQPGPGRPHG